MIFLVSTSGFLIYKSNCACTGNERVSVFINLETCNLDKQEKNEISMEGSCCSAMETTDCAEDSTECGCDSPEVKYIKLKNQLRNEEVKFVKIQPIHIFVVHRHIQLDFWTDPDSNDNKSLYIDPPPILSSSLDFLIQIQQLKIPYLA